jgi:hypothetical protein
MALVYGSFNLPVPKQKDAQVWTIDNTSDSDHDTLLATVTDAIPGDIAIINNKDGETTLSESPYVYDGEKWYGLTGTLDADKILIQEDIVCAGNYTQVGNITKTNTGTTTISSKGKTVQEVFEEIFCKRLQPTITANPSISGFALSGATSVEAGTKVSTATFGTAVLSAGSYKYGPATGITATSYSVDRVCVPTSLSSTGVASAASGSDNNSGNGFIIGDQGGDNVVSSLKYTITVEYGEGAVALDNLGGTSDPEIKIAAGSATSTTSAYTCYRKYFYGSTTDNANEITSDVIRSLTGSTKALTNGSKFTVDVVEGARRVIIAYPSTLNDISSVTDVNAFGTDITDSFVKSTVSVAGANNYTAIQYKVFVYEPATALSADTYNVTI